MLLDKKYFAEGSGIGMNGDEDAAFVQPQQWVNMENLRIGSTDAGVTGVLESIGSMVLKSAAEPSVTFACHGVAEDKANTRIIFFLKDLFGPWDKIMCYSLADNRIYTVLLANQVEGGLNFDRYTPIHSARVNNNILYWTDPIPRMININAAINLNHPGTFPATTAYTSPLKKDIITIIRKPPNYPPVINKVTDGTVTNNFITLFAGRFAVYYEFRDAQISVLSAYSHLVPYNVKTYTYNAVDVNLPFSEIIPQDVQRVHLCVQYGLDPNFFIVKSWDKAVTTESTQINNHNSGTTALTYRFYNAQTGIPLGAAYSVKPFDSVPLTSKTLEIVKNRLFLGNSLEGYDTPTITSLSAVIHNDTAGASLTGAVYKLVFNGGATTRYVLYVVSAGVISGFYRYVPDDTTPPPNPSAWANLSFLGITPPDVYRFYIPTWPTPDITSFSATGAVVNITGSGVTISLNGLTAFKSGGAYKIAICFFDRWMRKCGIVKDPNTYQIPDRSFTLTTYTTNINWSLSNALANVEIPDWAEYYCILRTRCLLTTYFTQARSKSTTASMTYVNRDASGAYTFATSIYSPDLAGVAIDITNLQNFGMGYAFTDGDIAKVFISGDPTVYQLRIIGQQARWVICELRSMGVLSQSTQALFELYTPYRESVNEAYYENGEVYAISNPGTSVRAYTVLNGSLNGDVTLLDRNIFPNNYPTENMSPNDTYWREWITDAGKPNFVDNIGQQLKKNTISYSEQYLPGTRTNGLSTFEAAEEKPLPEDGAQIQKLQLASKVQDEIGTVMLAICERETFSMYMGEAQQFGSASETNLVVYTNVIGSIQSLKGSYGTINPESVKEFRGEVYWYDAFNGKIIQYSPNGLFPISNYNMTRFWKQFSQQYVSMTYAQIEALGSRPFVYIGVDPHHWELLVSVPKLLNTPPKGFLPDYPSTVYPFDVWDGQAKTLVYKISAQPNFWQGVYTFSAEGFIGMQNKLFSFKNGLLYQHNDTSSYNNFYGQAQKSRIMFISNPEPDVPKVYNNISIEGSQLLPTLTYFRSELPYEQATDLMDFDWKNQESILYSFLYRNKLQATANGFIISGMLLNEKMRTIALRVMIEWTVVNTPVRARIINLGYQISAGHSTIPKT